MLLTSSTVLVLCLPVVVSLALSVPTLLRLFRGTRPEELSPEWLQSFSYTVYLPMERLLSSEDFSFLSRQPGFDLSLYRKLRKERLRIFRQYLERMIVDFNRLHLAARLAVAKCPGDHSQLLTHLITLKLRFSVAVLAAEFRYTLCCLGLRSLSVRTLLAQMEELSLDFHAASQLA
jgi:hypothetical protein